MSYLVRFVVYVRGRLLYENTTLLGAYEEFVKLGLDNYSVEGVCIFSECLIKDHEYHLTDMEGNRLIDVYAVTG